MSGRIHARAAGSVVAAAFLLGACGGGGEGFVNPPPMVQPVTVSIAPTTATVNIGATTSLAVSISGGSPTPTLASCTSSSPTTASVTVSGVSCVVVGVTPGSATITARTSAGQSASAAITVAPLPAAITELTLTPATASLAVGENATLTATPTSPAGASVAIAYSSSNAGVASVSVAGVVTAVSPGTATITATAVGGGLGFTPATISRTAVITVTADPCTPIPVTLPLNQSGVVGSSSCVISPGADRRGSVFAVNLPSATAVEVLMTPSNFAPYMAAFPQGENDFIFRSRPTADPVSGIWHLPSGLTEIRVGALNAGDEGSFQVQAQAVSASVENCRRVVVGGSVTSNQALQTTDCVFDNTFADEFLIYSTRPCTITMNRSTAANGMEDPFLEVYDGATPLQFDDDSNGGVNARVEFASCRTAGNSVLLVRATSLDELDTGAYSFGVVFGAAPGQAAEGSLSALSTPYGVSVPAKNPDRTFLGPPAGASGAAGSWLRHLGITAESRPQ